MLGLWPSVSLAGSSSTALTASPANALFGQAVTLTASVTPGTSTGLVTFYDGTKVLGTVSLSNGGASLVTTLLDSGKRMISAYYQGDASDAGGRSGVVAQTVKALPDAGFPTGGNIQYRHHFPVCYRRL